MMTQIGKDENVGPIPAAKLETRNLARGLFLVGAFVTIFREHLAHSFREWMRCVSAPQEPL